MKKALAYGSVICFPLVSMAAQIDLTYFTGAFGTIKTALNTIVGLLVAVGVIYFIWNVVKYIKKGAGANEKSEAVKGMTAGIIGLAVIVSVWGLVGLLQQTFGVNTTQGENVNNIVPRF